MIPYAICRGVIHWRKSSDSSQDACDTGEKLDIRLLELSPYGGVFRVPLGYRGRIGEIRSLEFTFYLRGQGTQKVMLDEDLQVSEVRTEAYWTEWRYHTTKTAYMQAARALTRDYLDYIDVRTSLEDTALSGHLLERYPTDEAFCTDARTQQLRFAQKTMNGLKPESWHWLISAYRDGLGLALQSREAYEAYLEKPFDHYVQDYWEGCQLSAHPLANASLSVLSVGNPYCPLQAPAYDQLSRILEKAWQEGLKVIYRLAPVSEGNVSEIQDFLIRLHSELMRRMPQGYRLTLEAGDAGLYHWLNTQDFSAFKVTRGRLMRKKLCDARLKYKYDALIADEADYVSGETMDVPYLQMNTGTFCPLYALKVYGDRGHLTRVHTCPGYCAEHVLLYPEALDMQGRFNSIFYVDLSWLMDGTQMYNAMMHGEIVIINML